MYVNGFEQTPKTAKGNKSIFRKVRVIDCDMASSRKFNIQTDC